MDESARFGVPLRAEELFSSETFGTRLSRRDGVAWMALGGELDVFTAPKLREALDAAHVGADERLVLDLRGLTFIDSSGLAVILAAHERALKRAREPVLILIRGAPAVEALFETIAASEYLNLIEDPADAITVARHG